MICLTTILILSLTLIIASVSHVSARTGRGGGHSDFGSGRHLGNSQGLSIIFDDHRHEGRHVGMELEEHGRHHGGFKFEHGDRSGNFEFEDHLGMDEVR